MSSSTSSPHYQMQPWRLWVIYGVVALVLGSLLFRLINLQVIQGIDWLDQAVENYTTTDSIAPARGIIYDRNGYILAGNIASYSVVITPANLPDSDADIQNIYRDLSELIDVPATQGTIEDAKLVAECVPGPGIEQLVALGESLAPYQPVKVKCDVDEEVARMTQQIKEGASKPKPKIMFEEGESIRVIDGPFANFSGFIDEVMQEKEKLRVMVQVFGRATPVVLDYTNVEKA